MLLLRALSGILLGHCINEIGDCTLHSPVDTRARLGTRIELDVRGIAIVCTRLGIHLDAVQIPAIEISIKNAGATLFNLRIAAVFVEGIVLGVVTPVLTRIVSFMILVARQISLGHRAGAVEHKDDVERLVDGRLTGDVGRRGKRGETDKGSPLVVLNLKGSLPTLAGQRDIARIDRFISPNATSVASGISSIVAG